MMLKQSAFISVFVALTTIGANANEITATTVGEGTAFDLAVSGIDNSIVIDQQSNLANIKSQTLGDGNSLNFQQLDTASLGGSNSIDFDITGNGNEVAIKQDGSLNKVYGKDLATDYEITGDNNKWNVEQTGTANELLVTPKHYNSSWNSISNNDIVDIKQIGNRNKIEFQNENGPNSSTNGRQVAITQEGDDNNIYTRGAYTSSAVMNFTQRGNGNRINSTARAEDLSLNGGHSVQTLNITQDGDRNYAEGYAWFNGSTANISQTGFYNHAFAYANNGDTATITQTGDQNSAYARYAGSGTITQIGNHNGASYANGINNIWRADPNGHYTITQIGDNNGARIRGTGYNNVFNVTQNGNGNNYELNHTGDNGVYTINQTSF